MALFALSLSFLSRFEAVLSLALPWRREQDQLDPLAAHCPSVLSGSWHNWGAEPLCLCLGHISVRNWTKCSFCPRALVILGSFDAALGWLMLQTRQKSHEISCSLTALAEPSGASCKKASGARAKRQPSSPSYAHQVLENSKKLLCFTKC